MPVQVSNSPKQDSPVLTPVNGQQERKIAPELKQKFDKVDALLAKTAKTEVGTEADKALQYVKTEYKTLVANNKTAPLTRAQQLDKLTEELRADGVFDVNDIQKLQAFQQGQMEAKPVTALPQAVVDIGKGIEFATEAMKEGSTTNNMLRKLNLKLMSEHPKSFAADTYKDILAKIHQNK